MRERGPNPQRVCGKRSGRGDVQKFHAGKPRLFAQQEDKAPEIVGRAGKGAVQTDAVLFHDGFGGGDDVAYTFPGLCRVLQAAGRVIRTETDRGAVLLMDVRYGQENLLSLLPEHWKVEKIKKMEALNARLNAFWKE